MTQELPRILAPDIDYTRDSPPGYNYKPLGRFGLVAEQINRILDDPLLPPLLTALGARAAQDPILLEEPKVCPGVTSWYPRRRKYEDNFLNGTHPIIAGPQCQELGPWLAADTYRYGPELNSLELREIIASSILAVLDDAERFTTIVGEDTSGRIPALIAGKAINIVRELHRLPKARRLFVSGRIDDEIMPSFRVQNPKDNALVVTEYVASAGSVNRALRALKRAGFFMPSALVLDRAGTHSMIDSNTVYMGNRTTYTGRADSHLYNLPRQLKGVTKTCGMAHSERVALKADERKKLIKFRKELDHFAQEIVKIWLIRQKTTKDFDPRVMHRIAKSAQ